MHVYATTTVHGLCVPVMELVDVEDVTKDDFSLPPQSQWNAHTLRVHGIIISLRGGGGGGTSIIVNVHNTFAVWKVCVGVAFETLHVHAYSIHYMYMYVFRLYIVYKYHPHLIQYTKLTSMTVCMSLM